MEVILLEDIINLGKLGEMVKVKDGYARNLLIPYKKALMATEKNKIHFEENKAVFEAQMKEKQEKAMSVQERVNGKEFTLAVATNEDGKLFGSVGAKEISEHLEENSYEIHPSQIVISSGSFRQIGTYEVLIQIYQQTEAKITVHIVSE